MLHYLKVAGTHWAKLTPSDNIILVGNYIKAIWTLGVIRNSSNSFQNLLGQLRIYSATNKYRRTVFEVKSTGCLGSLCWCVTMERSCADKLICAMKSLQTGYKPDILMSLMKTKERCNRQCQGTLWSGADRSSVAEEWYPGGLASPAKTRNEPFRFSKVMPALPHEIPSEATWELLVRAEDAWPLPFLGTMANLHHAYAVQQVPLLQAWHSHYFLLPSKDF